jgi:phosphatidylcholine synthase
LALAAFAHGRFRAGLAWMALALLIDAVDGALARALRARELLPQIDGSLLDNIVDYLNYAVVPAYLLYEARLLPGAVAWGGAAAVCIASALQFAHVEAKTSDHFFRGFPSYWNLVAFYLLLLEPPPWASLLVVLGLCCLTFAPAFFLYPSRTPEHRKLTLTLTTAWVGILAYLGWRYPDHPPWLVYASWTYVAYYVVLGARLSRRRVATSTRC